MCIRDRMIPSAAGLIGLAYYADDVITVIGDCQKTCFGEIGRAPVSYTHLDVDKRQVKNDEAYIFSHITRNGSAHITKASDVSFRSSAS